MKTKTKSISGILKVLSILFITSCCNKEDTSLLKQENLPKIYDYNVLIVPDLSNRINPEIHPKPLGDTLLINTIADHINDLLKIKGRQMNQLDVYKFDFINRGILNQHIADTEHMEINFRKFKNKSQDASHYKRYDLKTDITSFKNNIAKVYEYSLGHSAGSDVWNYFNQNIKNSMINEPDKKVEIAEDEFVITGTRNIAVLFTDGYIESANNSSGFRLDQDLIKKIRREFVSSGSVDFEKFILSKPEYLIRKTSDLNQLNVLVFEMVDRSLDKNGATTVQPTDFEIMKIIWKKWLKDSGAAQVEIYPALTNKTEAYEALKKFMEEIH
ncbi:hypothetical protein [Chryseobacterium sp. JM1]|uniref:hypothetical protein n=1 Tax=Chryseobacterium sp. JM1 TaxID=1233950 RepID=UPI000A56AD78|nr:hypothetical protein [Chryseobacterium sp. JM1]